MKKIIICVITLFMCISIFSCKKNVSDIEVSETTENVSENVFESAVASDEPTVINGVYYIKPGDKMPIFSCETNKGNVFDLSKCDKPAFINFWATWCGPCRMEMPDLQEIYEKYNDKVDFIFIDSGDSKETINSFLTEEMGRYTFPIGYDEENSLSMLFHVEGIPTTYVVTKDKHVKEVIMGAREGSFYERIIKDVLGE